MHKNYSFGLALKNNFVEFFYYEGMFLPHEVAKIQGFWDKEQTKKATVTGDEEYKDELRKSSVMFIDNKPKTIGYTKD
ncbi:MAG: PKHD-type hydroxylase [Candidatus Latescibacterota bacterium]|jgi:PKHD-type hydroxylase